MVSVMRLPYVITEPCIGVKDATCGDVCPVDCIHSSPEAEQYFIHPEECISCGACVEVCPVDAIYYEEDVPAEMRQFIEINANFFTSLNPKGPDS